MSSPDSLQFEDRTLRPRRTLAGGLLRLTLGLGCVAVAAVVVAVVLDWRPTLVQLDRSPVADAKSVENSRKLVAEKTSQPEPIQIATGISDPVDGGTSPILDALNAGVVKIESDRPGDTGALGAGFVIDSDGLVATSYHVVSAATRAQVRFRSGSIYDVAGYAALDPASDLAILKLEDSPPDLPSMQLHTDGEPAQLSSVVAVGHPHGIEFSTYDGTVSQVLQTSQLPPSSRDFLDQLMIGNDDHRWIQHTARIVEGYSGGPLLNERGQVIGVNIWMDRKTGAGYALHADHLRRLQAKPLPAVAPLDQYARVNLQADAITQRLNAVRLKQLLEDAQAMKWWPADANDYQTLQEMAWVITIANQPTTIAGDQRRGGLMDKVLDELLTVSDRIDAALRKEQWGAPGQMIVVNEFAANQVEQPNRGVFLFATALRTVSGEDGSRAVILRLAGMESELFLPLDGQLIDLTPGASYLILGVNYQGRVVRYGNNPLRPTIAPVIVSRTMIPLGDE